MVTNVKPRTACECSQELLRALNSGSKSQVRRALDQIADLSSCETPDSRESEFRDLLAGIVEPIATANSSVAAISVEILVHVASDGRSTGRPN